MPPPPKPRDRAGDYRTPDCLGPRRAVAFEGAMITDQDAAAADAHGHVDDLLRACRRRNLPINAASALGAG